MDWNSRFITAMVALFATLSLLVVGLWWAIGIDSAPALQQASAPVVRPARATGPRKSYLRGSEAMRARARIEDLETQLDRSQRLIDRKNQSLEAMRQQLLELRSRAREAEELSGLVFSAAQDHVEAQEESIAESLLGFADPPEGETEGEPFTDLDNPLAENPADPTTQEDASEPAEAEPDAAQLENELMEVRTALANVESELVLTQLARAEVIKSIGPDGLNGLIASLESPRAEVRAWACDALGEMGLEAAAAFAVLQQMRNDPDARVRERAAWAVTQVRE